jgi:hypothetical protein
MAVVDVEGGKGGRGGFLVFFSISTENKPVSLQGSLHRFLGLQ